ncbi:hypothetical protein [Massilia consociata]|uniref:Uncharacterized protein n=1 Tax=Massilia consociata TaxID=760117 RepID=A0ABV6FID3_9BURK
MFHSSKQSILMAVILAAPWPAAWAASPFAREVPTTYARFEDGAGSLTLVVTEVVATDYLKGYDCPESRTNADGSTMVSICLNPPPTWFKARVLQHVAGADIGDEFYAVTGSHWGAMKVGPAEPAKLMLLNSNGTALEMLRYRSWPLARSRDGQYHLVVEGGGHSLAALLDRFLEAGNRLWRICRRPGDHARGIQQPLGGTTCGLLPRHR